MKKQYKTFLVYGDGSVHPGEIFDNSEKMRSAVHAIARKPGVRYHCEEWTLRIIGESSTEPMKAKVAEYDL